MANIHPLTVYEALKNSPAQSLLEQPTILQEKTQKRPLSVSIEDAFFGDSGKGRITLEFCQLLSKKGNLYSLRFNGGANAGHECYIHGKPIVTHQLPIGVIQEGTTALMARGMVIHPQDLLTEITTIKDQFNGSLPGTLLIDERAPLSLDTHRALETAINSFTLGGRGSTGRGIATAYASIYERTQVTVRDLLLDNWKDTFKSHYQFMVKKTKGFGKEFALDSIPINRLGTTKKISIGSEKQFLVALSDVREKLAEYTSSHISVSLHDAWTDPEIPFVIEGAQGAGLDPFHGVYPDVTSSRPMSRFVNDATYNVIMPDEISLRVAVMKTTYMSSVGQRKLPTHTKKAHEKWIQKTFDERGRSTGRLRDIYEVSIPIAQYLKKAAGYEYLAATHLDAAQKSQKIQVVTHYTHKKTGKEMPYLPYQDYLNDLSPHIVEFKGWSTKEVQKAKTPEQLPVAAKTFLSFLSQTIAPVIIGTTSPELGSYISWLPEL